jgi:hypothetical protein
LFFVILNEVKDLDPVDKNRFFATLRMTKMGFLEFFNSFIDSPLGLPQMSITFFSMEKLCKIHAFTPKKQAPRQRRACEVPRRHPAPGFSG